MILERFAYLEDCTLGWITLGELRVATIERPWIPVAEHKGGKVRESCVPDGTYRLIDHRGPRFPGTFALENPALDVYYMPARTGRSAILIHAGNTAKDVVGCIAIGLQHGKLEGEHAVYRSVAALTELQRALRGKPLPELTIRPTAGTAGGAPYAKT